MYMMCTFEERGIWIWATLLEVVVLRRGDYLVATVHDKTVLL